MKKTRLAIASKLAELSVVVALIKQEMPNSSCAFSLKTPKQKSWPTSNGTV